MNAEKILKFIAQHDLCFDEIIWWDTNLQFYFTCNDLFMWACSDAEKISDENIDEIVKSLEDCKKALQGTDYDPTYFFSLLYCCRARKTRPQKPYYKHLPKKLHSMFDECGPEATC